MKNITVYIFLLLSFISSAQNPSAFACVGSDGFGYYCSSAASTQNGSILTYSSSRISKLTTFTGVNVTLCEAATIGVAINGMAFNPQDNFLYAVSRYDATQFSGKLYRIGENCQKIEIPVNGDIVKFSTNNISTIDAAGGNISSATFDLDNNYYVNTSFTQASAVGFTNKLQKLSISDDQATVMSTTTLTCPTCIGTNSLRVTDIIFDEVSGVLYGSNEETKKLYSINSTTGVLKEIGVTGITTAVLAMYKNKDGNIRAISTNGNIYGVNLETGNFTFLSNSPILFTANADGASGCYDPPKISGHLYLDSNGLSDNLVRGRPTNSAGTTLLYANLVFNGLVIKSDNIDVITGYYQFLGSFSGTYEVQISASKGTIGQVPPAQTLPNTYIFTGEFIGNTTGNDGSPNGRIYVDAISGVDVCNVNFGIDGKPIATSITGTIQPNPGGTTQVAVPTLMISDPEESGINNVTIELIPNPVTLGTLYYNGIAVTPNQYIPNYVPALLTFDPVDGEVAMVFTYFTTDMAGVVSNSATVTQPFSEALPIVLVNFAANFNGVSMDITWSTSSEINNDYFSIQKSTDGKLFKEIEVVFSRGNSLGLQYYAVEDKEAVGLTYYRLMQVDESGSFSYSHVISALAKGKSTFQVYPTLVDQYINVDQIGNTFSYSYRIVNYQGQVIDYGRSDKENLQIVTSKLSQGFYILMVINETNSHLLTFPFQKL